MDGKPWFRRGKRGYTRGRAQTCHSHGHSHRKHHREDHRKDHRRDHREDRGEGHRESPFSKRPFRVDGKLCFRRGKRGCTREGPDMPEPQPREDHREDYREDLFTKQIVSRGREAMFQKWASGRAAGSGRSKSVKGRFMRTCVHVCSEKQIFAMWDLPPD